MRKYFGLYRSVINLTATLRRGGIFIPKQRVLFFIHKLAIRDSIDNCIDLHCHKKCSARSDAMNITEIHER